MSVPERVVISGAGCCTALGHDLDSVARSLREGRDAFRASGALEGLSVCPAEDWGQDEARQQFEGWRHRHYLNRGSRMAVLSGLRALRDAGLEAGLLVRSQIIAAVNESLTRTRPRVWTTSAARPTRSMPPFTTIHALGICNFLCDDLPELARFIPEEDARTHYLSSAQGIFDMLRRAKIHFSQSDETVLAAIRILYLSIININRIGTDFFPALHLLVIGACEELVA